MRQIPWSEARAAELEVLLTREWLVTNGLGGYAAGDVSGIPTRRYHSFLVAALPAPFGCMRCYLRTSALAASAQGRTAAPAHACGPTVAGA